MANEHFNINLLFLRHVNVSASVVILIFSLSILYNDLLSMLADHNIPNNGYHSSSSGYRYVLPVAIWRDVRPPVHRLSRQPEIDAGAPYCCDGFSNSVQVDFYVIVIVIAISLVISNYFSGFFWITKSVNK